MNSGKRFIACRPSLFIYTVYRRVPWSSSTKWGLPAFFFAFFPALGANQRQHALQRVDHRLPTHCFAVPLENTALGADFLS